MHFRQGRQLPSHKQSQIGADQLSSAEGADDCTGGNGGFPGEQLLLPLFRRKQSHGDAEDAGKKQAQEISYQHIENQREAIIRSIREETQNRQVHK